MPLKNSPLATLWRSLSPTTQGALWMLASAASFAAMSAFGRYAATVEGYHPFVVFFWRNVGLVVMLLPMLYRAGFSRLRTRRWPLLIARGIISTASALALFWGLAHVPVADAMALVFSSPIFATIFTIALLGERPGRLQIAAIILGFIGAVVILRPGFQEVTPDAMIVMGSAVLAGGAFTLIKVLSATEPADVILAYLALSFMPASFVLAVIEWQTPDLVGFGVLALTAVTAGFGHFALPKAFAKANATAVMPLDFARLPFAALFGYVLFREISDAWTWSGAVIIFVAGLMVTRGEKKTAR